MHKTGQPLINYNNYEKALANYTITRNNSYPVTITAEYHQHVLENITFEDITIDNTGDYTIQYEKITSIPPEIIIKNFLNVYRDEIKKIIPRTTKEYSYDQTKWKITLNTLEIQEVKQDPPVARELKELAKDLYPYCYQEGSIGITGHNLVDHIYNKIQVNEVHTNIYYSNEQPETHLWIILDHNNLQVQNMPSRYIKEVIQTFGEGFLRKIPEAMIYEIRYNE